MQKSNVTSFLRVALKKHARKLVRKFVSQAGVFSDILTG